MEEEVVQNSNTNPVPQTRPRLQETSQLSSPDPEITEQKPGFVIGIAVLFLLLLIVIGFLAHQNFQLRKQVNQLEKYPKNTKAGLDSQTKPTKTEPTPKVITGNLFVKSSTSSQVNTDNLIYVGIYNSKKMYVTKPSSFAQEEMFWGYVVQDETTHTSYNYTPSYHKSEKLADNSFSEYFYKLDIHLSNGDVADGFYTPYWFWCGGTNGYRTLRLSFGKYLEAVGSTSAGENVYILSKDTPFFSDQHLIPSKKKTDFYLSEQITESEWKEFLDNQANDYPILVVPDPFGNFLVYFHKDYLVLPGC